MLRIERPLVGRDRIIRFAVRNSGTAMTLSLDGLCGSVGNPSAAKAVVLQSPTRLEFLQHSECAGGEPVGGIDKVLVLDGLYKGTEGRVITSELWRPLPLPQPVPNR